MRYVPKQGDIVYITLDPQAGHEQKGRRPAMVVSNDYFNRLASLAIFCPITNTQRSFPLHIALDERTATTGFLLCEQTMSLDYVERAAEFVEKAPHDIVEKTVHMLNLCIKEDIN